MLGGEVLPDAGAILSREIFPRCQPLMAGNRILIHGAVPFEAGANIAVDHGDIRMVRARNPGHA